MIGRVLFVDDDVRVLNGVARQLESQFELDTAQGPEEGLERIRESGPYSVVVTDMRMPGMTGVELLAEVRKISPDTARIMLTGFGDLKTTIQAVNEGNIYRFLAKPCPPNVLASALEDGIRHYNLVTAEHELVRGTLIGSVKVLSEVLGMTNPKAFGRAARVQRVVAGLARIMEIENAWELEIAALLYPLGYVTVPDEILNKVAGGYRLTTAEREVYEGHPREAGRLLRNIPRLEAVAAIIGGQAESDSRCESSASSSSVELGKMILKVALEYDAAEARYLGGEFALTKMRETPGRFDERVLSALETLVTGQTRQATVEVAVSDLAEGMMLATDVLDTKGKLLVAQGHEVTFSLKQHLQGFANSGRLKGTVTVHMISYVPEPTPEHSVWGLSDDFAELDSVNR